MSRIHATARGLFIGLSGLALASVAGAQTYNNNTSVLPQGSPANNSSSENIDFGDVDLDGDFDAIFADGGDSSNDQNRLWMNQGFAQSGTLGTFVDDTAARLPAFTDQSRDVEFVDFDADGDLDLYVSNTSAIVNQTNRWLQNQGGGQLGSAGFFVDQTNSRWVGLGGAGSSIAPGEVLGAGGFVDFSCDCDFADLDNDGDLDLVHSSYGGVFGGQVPTRLFLNDGLGFFSEFNPSGVQLTNQTISNGTAAIWCEGVQQSNTTNSTGTQSDIAASALDIDVGDFDGDLDHDILHGARDENTRIFLNNHSQAGSLVAFRDVSFGVMQAGWSPGGGHYEQEIGDCDGDGDLDIYGLNWASLSDFTMENDGSANFGSLSTLSGSGADDNEGDFVDYDNDGDLDIFVTSFGAANRLYRNNNNGGGSGFNFTNVSAAELSPQNIATGLDGDGCDVDQDGDMDFLVSHDNGSANSLYENTSGVADTHAPTMFHLEQAPDRTPDASPTSVRVHVYDNAPYYITWYNDTRLEVTVDGGSATIYPMRNMGGQIFRGEIPGTLVGTVCYRVLSTDQDGNTGASGQLCYTAGVASFCDASDGSLASCPCGNAGAPDTGCDLQQATGGVRLDVLVQQTSPLNRTTVQGTGYPGSFTPTAIALRGTGLEATPVVFGDGLRCVTAPVVRLGAAFAIGGTSTHTFGHGIGAGSGTFFYQLWFRNSPAMFCTPDAFNLSNGRTVTW